MATIPERMRAVVVHEFGGPEKLAVEEVPVPAVGAEEVLVRVEWAGVGEWDPYEREGGFVEMMGGVPRFPLVLGSEGAGSVAAVGERVDRFEVGDRVYALGFLSPKGGFYAEYAAVPAELVAAVPGGLSVEQAAGLGFIGVTALRGLELLGVKPGERVLVFGASGGVGHVAVQLAKRMGARVIAVASGADGVALVERLGADGAVDGRGDDVAAAVRAVAPDGVDAALVNAGGEAAEAALEAVRAGGRIAYPHGVEPEPRPRPGVQVSGYDGEPDREVLERLGRLVEAGPFEVHVGGTYALEQVAEAQAAVERHHLGKIVLRIGRGG